MHPGDPILRHLDPRVSRRGRLALVLLLAALSAAWGMDARDLGGDELSMLHGDPLQIALAALDPRAPFTGHLPWSPWLRAAALALFGEQQAWAWRLHAGLGLMLAAAFTWKIFDDRERPWSALAAAALLALHPVARLHAHDAGNYAWSLASGAWILAALLDASEGRPRGGLLLALGLGVAGWNDLWSGLVGIGALAAWGGFDRERRRALLPGLLGGLLFVAPVLLLLGARLLVAPEGGLVAAHAEAAAPSSLPLPLDVAFRLLNRFFGSALGGFAAGRVDAAWESLPPIALGVALLLGASGRARGSPERRAATLVSAALGTALLMGIGFRLATDRSLPFEPRATLGLLPPLLIAVIGLIGALPRAGRLGVTLPVALVLGAAAFTAASEHPDLRAQAAALIRAGFEKDDQIVGDQPLGWRLARGEDPLSVLPCADALPPGRIWWLVDHGTEGRTPACAGASLSGLHTLAAWTLEPTEQERNSASFQPVRILSLLSRTPPPTAARTIQIHRALLDGLDQADFGTIGSGIEGHDLTRGLRLQAGAALDRLAATPSPPSGLPDWTLFDPYRRELAVWESWPAAAGPDPILLRAPPLRAPGWRVLRRVLPLLSLGVLLAPLALPLLRGRPRQKLPPLPSPAWPRWTGPLAFTSSALLLLGLLIHRLLPDPVEVYGDSGAGWIEHLALLRTAETWARTDGGLLDRLRAVDGLYPPLLHLRTLPVSALFDHDPAAVFTMPLGLGLLAAALASLTRSLGGRPWVAATAALLLPALHASAARYAYDLPMTALLWGGAALLVAVPRGGILLAGAAGIAFGSACLLKWSALPFGLPILLGAGLLLPSWGERARAIAVAALVATALIGLFLWNGSSSFGAMAGATFQPPPDTLLPTWLEALPLGHSLGAMAVQAAHLDAARLAFYPLRLATTVFSPLLILPFLWGLGDWLRARAPGAPLLLLPLLGHGLFLLLLLPPTDERFLLPLLPALALAWSLGARGWLLPLGLGVASWVAIDQHSGGPGAAFPPDSSDPERSGMEWRPRLGLSTSWDRRGWVRADQREPDRGPLRERIMEEVDACGATVILVPDALVETRGDANWWAAAALRAQLGEGGPGAPTLQVEPWPPTSRQGPPADLLLLPEPRAALGLAPAEPGARWRQVRLIVDPQGGSSVSVWRHPSDLPCRGEAHREPSG